MNEETEEIKTNVIVEEKNNNTTKYILNFLLIIVILCVLVFWYASSLGTKGLIIKEYKVDSSILTKNYSGIKIVHFDSLLYGSTVTESDIDNLVKKINILKPDIVVFTGDLVSISKKISEEEKEFLINSLKNINAKIGKYSSKGDYDYSLNSYEEIMEKGGFKVIKNSYEKIYYKNNDFIYIVGLPSDTKDIIDFNSSFEFYSDQERKYTICLLHEGSAVTKLNNTNYEVDLVLGGHSLNGSVILPLYGPLFISSNEKYYGETYEKGITKIFISSGLGTKEYAYRFLNKPSINLYRLKSTQ